MLTSHGGAPLRTTSTSKKLRSSCDYCHQTKVKCTGTRPCEKCERIGFDCIYSVSNRTGRPKHTRNKKTLERARQSQVARQAREAQSRSGESVTSPTLVEVASSRLASIADHVLSLNESSLNLDLEVVGDDALGDLPTPVSSANRNGWGSPGLLSDTEDFLPLRKSIGPNGLVIAQDIWGNERPMGGSSTPPSLHLLHPDSDYSCSENGSAITSTSDLGSNHAIDPSLITKNLDIRDREQSSGSRALDQELPPMSMEAITLAQPDTEIGACQCLDHQADLTLRLRRYGKGEPDLGAALTLASHAAASLQGFLHCYKCGTFARAHKGCALEVMAMAVMNLRLTLCAMYTLVKNITLNGKIQATDGFANQCRHHTEKAIAELKGAPSRSYVGAYEMDHEENKVVASLLLIRTLSKLHSILAKLQRRVEELECLASSGDVSSRSDDDLLPSLRTSTPRCCHCKCNCADTTQRKPGRELEYSDSVVEELSLLKYVRCTLQKLDKETRLLKNQIKAYFSANA